MSDSEGEPDSGDGQDQPSPPGVKLQLEHVIKLVELVVAQVATSPDRDREAARKAAAAMQKQRPNGADAGKDSVRIVADAICVSYARSTELPRYRNGNTNLAAIAPVGAKTLMEALRLARITLDKDGLCQIIELVWPTLASKDVSPKQAAGPSSESKASEIAPSAEPKACEIAAQGAAAAPAPSAQPVAAPSEAKVVPVPASADLLRLLSRAFSEITGLRKLCVDSGLDPNKIMSLASDPAVQALTPAMQAAASQPPVKLSLQLLQCMGGGRCGAVAGGLATSILHWADPNSKALFTDEQQSPARDRAAAQLRKQAASNQILPASLPAAHAHARHGMSVEEFATALQQPDTYFEAYALQQLVDATGIALKVFCVGSYGRADGQLSSMAIEPSEGCAPAASEARVGFLVFNGNHYDVIIQPPAKAGDNCIANFPVADLVTAEEALAVAARIAVEAHEVRTRQRAKRAAAAAKPKPKPPVIDVEAAVPDSPSYASKAKAGTNPKPTARAEPKDGQPAAPSKNLPIRVRLRAKQQVSRRDMLAALAGAGHKLRKPFALFDVSGGNGRKWLLRCSEEVANAILGLAGEVSHEGQPIAVSKADDRPAGPRKPRERRQSREPQSEPDPGSDSDTEYRWIQVRGRRSKSNSRHRRSRSRSHRHRAARSETDSESDSESESRHRKTRRRRERRRESGSTGRRGSVDSRDSQ